MKEIECKLLDITASEFEEKARRRGVELELFGNYAIVDSYWLNDVDTPVIRLRRFTSSSDLSDGILHEAADLTVKDEDEGFKHSQRNECRVPLSDDENVDEFLECLGYAESTVICKDRTIWTYNLNDETRIRIHHDFVREQRQNWVEVEADTSEALYAFLFKMGYKEEDMCKESTLDLLGIKL